MVIMGIKLAKELVSYKEYCKALQNSSLRGQDYKLDWIVQNHNFLLSLSSGFIAIR